MEDNNLEQVMFLIVTAGQAKSHAMNAIKYAREYNFDKANEELELSNSDFVKAHEIQTGLISQDLNNKPITVNLLVVHSQDHLTSAMNTKEMAVEMIHLYKKLYEMEVK